MNDELKDYKAPRDSFQLIEEGAAGIALLVLVIQLLFFWSYFQ